MAQKSNNTKKNIITVALQLIKERGYDHVTLNDICKAAAISKHTFYYYFPSKEALLLDFFTIPRDITTSKLSSLLETEHYFDQYWQLLEPMLDFCVESGLEVTKRILIANIGREIGTFSKPEMEHDLMKVEMHLIKKAQEAGEIRNPNDPMALLWTAKMQLFGVLSGWCMTNGKFDLKFDLRTGLETTFDVIPSIRKGNFEVMKA
ncbi:MAG: TetR/AcrR family transcriptional regulator, partial [Bacillaceae bacterium]